jgi:hypothetical protein
LTGFGISGILFSHTILELSVKLSFWVILLFLSLLLLSSEEKVGAGSKLTLKVSWLRGFGWISVRILLMLISKFLVLIFLFF